MRSKSALLALGLSTLGILTASLSANAAVINFSYSGTAINASGQLTTNDITNIITSITGQRNGVSIASLLPPDSLGINDNVFIPSGDPAFLTVEGVFYQTEDGSKFNWYFGDTYRETAFSSGNVSSSISVTPTFTPVPEPLTIIGSLAALGVGAGLKCRFKDSAA